MGCLLSITASSFETCPLPSHTVSISTSPGEGQQGYWLTNGLSHDPCHPLVCSRKCGFRCGPIRGGKEMNSCFSLHVSGRALVRGPSSLKKKAELSEDQIPDTTMEESSTSLAPTILYLTTFEAAPATEETLILPVTSLWPQVRCPSE